MRVLVLSAILAACFIRVGHAGYEVTLLNGGQIPVLYSIDGARDSRVTGIRVEPGAKSFVTWMYPNRDTPGRVAKVEASDLRGAVVYCRTFTWEQVEARYFQIDLIPGILKCS